MSFFLKLHTSHAIDVTEHTQCLHKSGSNGVGQVNLRHVTGNHHLGIHAKTRQNIFI